MSARSPAAAWFAAVTLMCLAAAPGRFTAAAGAASIVLPPVTRATLKNGLIVIISPTHRLPLVDFRLVARAGSSSDPPGKEGLAGLTADLLTQGAGARSARQLAEDIALVGGTLDATALAEQFVVTCEVLKKDVATGFELFHDVLVAPAFPAEEFARKKDEALSAIAAARDDPSSVADRALLPFLLGSGPLAHPVSGWEKSVASLTREDVTAFQRRLLTPDNAILVVVGDVDPQALIAQLQRGFADWKPSGQKRILAAEMPARAAGVQVRIVSKPEVTQTQIRLATLGVARNHPDYFPIQVANTILGAGFTSRLVNQIRVVEGLSYGISSDFTMYRNAGTFEVNTFTKNETLRKTIDETRRVMREFITQGPTDEEVAKAKRYLTGLYPLGLQAPDDLAGALAGIEFYALDPQYIANYDSKVNAVTPDDVRRALRSYFDVDNLRILVVSDPATAKGALEGLGPIEVTAIP